MKAEFGVHDIKTVSYGRARISGRMFFGTLNVGDVFTRAFKIHRASPDKDPEREIVGFVILKITKIVAYGKK